VDSEIRCDSDEILVERAVVDGAETETVADDGLTGLLGVGDDVRCVEQPHLAEPAYGAAVSVRGKHGATELRLMNALLDLPDDVAPFDFVGNVDGLALVVRPAHLPEVQQDAELGGLVSLDVSGVDRPVPVRPRADEVDDRHVEQVRAAEPVVEVVLGILALIAVKDAVGRLLVLVPDLLRGLLTDSAAGPRCASAAR